MAFRPVNPYETLVQQLLENVTRTAESTERGLLNQRDERLIQEERGEQQRQLEQQRAWQQADYQTQREDELTDRAESHRIGLLTRFQDLAGYVLPDNPMHQEFTAALRALSEPSGLSGRAAWDQAASGTYAVTVGDEQKVANVYALLSQAVRDRDNIMRNEGWQDALITNASNAIMNTGLPDDTRKAWADLVVGASFFTDDSKHMFLEAAGIRDKEQRDRIILEDRMREGDYAFLELQIATASTNLGQMLEKHEWARDWHNLDFEEAQRQYERNEVTFQQTTRMNDLEVFLAYGWTPDDEDRKLRLAQGFGFESTEGLDELGKNLWDRFNEREDLTNSSMRLANELTGQNLDLGRVQIKQARLTYDRDVIWGAIGKELETAEYAMAAALNGDVETLRTLAALKDTPLYANALRNLEIDDLIARAEAIRGYGDAKRAYDTRELEVLSGALERGQVTDIQAFIAQSATHFLDEDFTAGTDGSRPGLEAAVTRWAEGIPGASIKLSGYVTAEGRPDIDAFIDAVVREAVRLRVGQDKSEAAIRLTTLISVPFPEDPQQAESMRLAIQDAAEQAGFTPEEAAAMSNGLSDKSIAERNKAYADMRVTQQQADYYFVQTLTSMFSAVGGSEGKTDIETYSEMLGLAETILQGAQGIVDGKACSITPDHADFVQGGSNFNSADPVCVAAQERVDSWSRIMEWLGGAAIGGTGGDEVTLSRPPPETPGAGAIGTTAERLPTDREMNVLLLSTFGEEGAARFNSRMYAYLPPEIQEAVVEGIRSGVSVDDANEAMIATLAALDSQGPMVVPPQGLPRLADIEGVDLSSSDWRRRSVEDRASVLEGTEDWMELAAQIANGEVANTPANVQKWAARFGFMSPRTIGGRAWQGFFGGIVDAVGGPDVTSEQVNFYANTDDFLTAMNASVAKLTAQRDARLERAGMQAGGMPFNPAPGSNLPVQGPAREGRFAPSGAPPTAPPTTPEGQAEAASMDSLIAQLMRETGISPASSTGSGISGQSAIPQGGGESVPAPEGSPTIRTSETGLQEIRNSEKFSPEAYWDVNGWAVGYGQHNVPEAVEGGTVTQERAEQLLRTHVAGVEKAISDAVGDSQLQQHQWDALVSLVYNIGTGAFAESRIPALIKAGDMQGAANEFLKFNKADGQVLAGLTARRQRERAMFLGALNGTAQAGRGR